MAQNIKQVLIVSPEPWNGHFVSKHHYAVTLAKAGSHVYFLNPPDNSISKSEVKETQYKNLWEIKATKVARGLRLYPGFIRGRIERKWLKNVEKLIKNQFDIIWLFENSRFYDMGFAGHRLKIYHQVDSNQNFHISKAATTADICFCTTDFIKNKLDSYSNLVYKIHHGVLSEISDKSLDEIQATRFLKHKLNVVLIGNLDIKYLDLNILEALIKSYPHIGFHLVGGYKEDGLCYTKCNTLKNTFFWGKVESQIIPSILSLCDVSLLLYKAETKFDIEQLASPHKIMEYLASGKVTVATYTDEYKDKRELLEMVDKNSDYLSKFDTVIKELVHYNSAEKQTQRKSFANEHTYSKQLSKIVCHLKANNLIK